VSDFNGERLMHIEFWLPIPDGLEGERLFDWYVEMTDGIAWFATTRLGLPAECERDYMATGCVEDFDGNRLEWKMGENIDGKAQASEEPEG
jgi:hypothetical protein